MEPVNGFHNQREGAYVATVGLEVHAQLKTDTKIFCGCRTDFGAEPNTQTCPVCLGLPGALPVLNDQAVRLALRAGLATHCRIASRSLFARKNYFYPDVPKNYQITQYDRPLCSEGWLELPVGGEARRYGITRIHLEEDAGKLLHGEGDGSPTQVDLNRAGVPLIEIVTAPDMCSGEEAIAFVTHLREILVYLDVCDGNMEEGSLRCDANVSICPQDDAEPGTKVEVKNMNSLKAVRQAVEYEIQRQSDILARGERVAQQTRGWDADVGRTRFMRSKEYVQDYRYFPEPDLPPLAISDEELRTEQQSLPELPSEKRARWMQQFGLPAYDADLLSESPQLADYFEATAIALGDGKAASNWIMSELLAVLRERNWSVESFPVTPADLAELLRHIQDGVLSSTLAKEVFAEMIATGQGAATIVQQKGLRQTSDKDAITTVVSDVLAQHPEEVRQYARGKQKLFGFFMGEVMDAMGGRANPQIAHAILQEELSRRSRVDEES